MSRRKRHRIKLRSVYVWHRYVGVSVALSLLILVVTGIMLNHTDGLRLAQRYVHAPWLLNWYGIHPPQQVSAYPAQGHWLSQWDAQIYFDTRTLDTPPAGSLRGMVATADMLIAAWPDSVLLLTPRGERIDRLDSGGGLPEHIQAIGLSAGRVVVRSAQGLYRADKDLLNWQALPATDAHSADTLRINWSRSRPLPDALRQTLSQRYRGHGLPLERVVQDIHSGRILGRWGVWLVDAAAVLMGFLALSGVWLWGTRLLRGQTRRS